MSKKEFKTNAMRMLDQLKIPYESLTYECDEFISGISTADLTGLPHELVYKTLVTTGKTGEHYVFVIPIEGELDLKKAAKAVGEKSIAMLPAKELLPLTGYVHGGCSPVGMKKRFPTVFHRSCLEHETICVSAGKVGFQVEVRPADLIALVGASTADVAAED